MPSLKSLSSRAAPIILWLAMLAVVVVCAGATYEHVVIVPSWTKEPPASVAMFHGPFAIHTELWWRVVHIPALSLALLAFALLAGHPRRRLVGLAALLYGSVMAVTLAWYVPELLSLIIDMNAPIPAAEWKQRADRWEIASLVRLGVMYATAALLVRAASAPSKQEQPAC
jgi:hypothetical protein